MKATDFCEYILQRVRKQESVVTPLKLMKLAYISYGWYSAFYNKQLFSDTIEAWKYGPVIPSIYHDYKRYKNNPITHMPNKYNAQKIKEKLASDIPKNNTGITALQLIDSVIDNYSKINGLLLSSMTHADGTPWDLVNDGSRNNVISFDVIQSYYQNKVKNLNVNTGTKLETQASHTTA
ncbi:MAG: type II toxin-antitoxin system antitoxin SocA domain-containing protein [Leptospirales bacterium]